MLLRRACQVGLAIGLLVVASCGDVEVRASHPTSPRSTVGNRDLLAPRATSTTTSPPDVRGALTALSHVVGVMFPPTTTTTTTAPPVTVPPVRVAQTVDGDYHSWSDWPEWQRLGRCEQPNDAYPDGIWWNRPGLYPGGLGILASSWSENRAPDSPSRGDLASPGQQIIVARRIRDRYGWSAWACATSFGW